MNTLVEKQAVINPADEQQESCAAWLSAFTDYLLARSLDGKTISAYVRNVRKFQKQVAKDLAAVTREDLRGVVNQWQQEGASDNTIWQRVVSLRSFYNFIFVGGYIEKRPTTNLQVPKGWDKVPRTPAAKKLERVIAAIGRDDPFDLRNRAILLLFRDSGPRASAVAYARLSDMDWEQRRLFIRKDKFSKQHYLPLSHRTLEAITEYVNEARPYFLRGRDLPWLFVGYSRNRAADRTEPITRQQLCNIAKRWTKQVLGIAISPHKWRAACLTEGAEKDMDVFDLMNLAGHSRPELTQVYIRHQIGHLKKAYRNTHPRAQRRPHVPK